jgi:sec-independent protein translocase protein TatA
VLSGLESPMHLGLLLLIAALVFGPKRLPSIGRSLGAGIREFKATVHGDDDKGS